MAKDNKYLLYGDDNRVEQQQLEDLAEETDDLLAGKSKKRKKQAKNAQPDELDDLEDLDFDNPSPDASDESPEQNEDDSDEQPTEEEKNPDDDFKKDSDTEEEQPEKKNLVVPLVLLAIVIAGLLIFAGSLLAKPKQTQTTADVLGRNNTEKVENTETPEATEDTIEPTEAAETASADDSDVVGYLVAADPNHKYELGETLRYASSVNSAALSYLKAVTTAVQEDKSNDTEAIKNKLGTRLIMLGKDIDTLKTYETMFTTYSGAKYIAACEARFTNIRDMYEAAMKDYPDSASRINVVNTYINKENGLADNAKETLKEYLDANQVQYTENGDEVQYTY